MDTSRLEYLLEQLIQKQDEVIERIGSLESTIAQQLIEVNGGVSELAQSSSQIHDELNWWKDGHYSFAKRVLEALAGIESVSGDQRGAD